MAKIREKTSSMYAKEEKITFHSGKYDSTLMLLDECVSVYCLQSSVFVSFFVNLHPQVRLKGIIYLTNLTGENNLKYKLDRSFFSYTTSSVKHRENEDDILSASLIMRTLCKT